MAGIYSDGLNPSSGNLCLGSERSEMSTTIDDLPLRLERVAAMARANLRASPKYRGQARRPQFEENLVRAVMWLSGRLHKNAAWNTFPIARQALCALIGLSEHVIQRMIPWFEHLGLVRRVTTLKRRGKNLGPKKGAEPCWFFASLFEFTDEVKAILTAPAASPSSKTPSAVTAQKEPPKVENKQNVFPASISVEDKVLSGCKNRLVQSQFDAQALEYVDGLPSCVSWKRRELYEIARWAFREGTDRYLPRFADDGTEIEMEAVQQAIEDWRIKADPLASDEYNRDVVESLKAVATPLRADALPPITRATQEKATARSGPMETVRMVSDKDRLIARNREVYEGRLDPLDFWPQHPGMTPDDSRAQHRLEAQAYLKMWGQWWTNLGG